VTNGHDPTACKTPFRSEDFPVHSSVSNTTFTLEIGQRLQSAISGVTVIGLIVFLVYFFAR
jgi:hypothetical protein